MSPHSFPTVEWTEMGVSATFVPAAAADSEYAAVIVFAWTGDSFLLADIIERGWCTPSGTVEPGESPATAAVRETLEETGADLHNPILLGHYELRTESGSVTKVAAFVGRVSQWQSGFAGPESARVGAFRHSDLPTVYYRWDELLRVVFEYAQRIAVQNA